MNADNVLVVFDPDDAKAITVKDHYASALTEVSR
jgi:hypothetical protein